MTLAALGGASKGHPIVAARFRKSLEENDLNDIFSNALLFATLGDPRGRAAFTTLKERFKGDSATMAAVTRSEAQLAKAIGTR